MLGSCEAENGTQIDERLQARANMHQRAWQDVETGQILEDGRVPAEEAKIVRLREKRRITRKEYKRMMNEFEM